ncbi:MAG: YncE family protein [Kofleriaceae bacterium]
MLGVGLLIGACTADPDEVAYREDELYFPTGIAISPDDRFAFVVNANSELRWDSGAIMVMNLDEVDRIVADWTTSRSYPDTDEDGDGNGKEGDSVPAREKKGPDRHANGETQDCIPDPDHTETLECDEARFFEQDKDIQIGNFATDISIQDLGGGRYRLFVPTRGNPAITWTDWVDDKLTCVTCDTDQTKFPHELAFVLNQDDLAGIPEEPYNVYADSVGEFAMVTHLTTGAVTLIDSPKDSDAVIVTDVLQGIFAGDQSGIPGATGVVGSPTGSGVVYVGSRTEDRIQTFTVGRPQNGAYPYLLPGKWFFLNAVGGFAGGSSDTRGMTFSQDGNRLYLVNRRPASLQVIDTSISATGVPKDEPLGATDICRQGSTVAVSGTGADERAYVSCFQDGQVYVVDPSSGVYVEDIVLSGRGPYSVAVARSRNKVYVTNFLEDTISVIDIAPSSPTRNRVVLRIGIPRSL